MKKLFFFAAALLASVSVNAQFAKFDGIAAAESEAEAKTAGTVLATTNAFEASVAFDDYYKTVNLKHEGYGWWEIDGANLNAAADTLGLQGANNPKDADGNNPANACTTPYAGAVYQVVAKADGYLYIFHKASSNKQYMVEENGIPIGYHFGMVTTDVAGYFGEAGATKVIEYTIEGNNELGQITDGRQIMYAVDYIKQEGDTTIGTRDYTRNGLGVIGVPCRKGSTYWFHATASRMTALGVAFYPMDKDIYAVNEDGTKVKIYTGEDLIPVQVLVDVESACRDMGTVSIKGAFYKNNYVTLTATPNDGYRFVEWSDGNKEATRVIRLTSDTTLYATFEEGIYQCGSDLYWNYKDNVLRLFGSGAMDITNYAEERWAQYINEIYAISLPAQLTSICDYAFTNAKHLAAITIPAEVVSIGESAFEDCRLMDSVVFAGNKVLSIGDWAFYNCHNISQITIPEGVTSIGNGAFYGCAYLKDLVLPSTLEDISDNGFALCAQLRQMTVNAVEPPTVDSKTFENVNRAIPVHVPNGSGKKYRAAAVWQEFNIVDESEPTGMEQVNAAVAAPRKVVRDGQVLIIRGNEVYTVLGETIQ